MTTLFIFLGLFFGLCLFFRVPAAFSLGIGAAGAFIYNNFPTTQMCQAIYNQLDSFSFLAIPMFILAGAIMEHGQISESLINWIKFFIGKIRGSLGLVTIIASTAFGVITGSAMATISAIGRIMGPSLERNGYSKPYIGALLDSCGFLGIMIPPSIPGIMYASASGASTSDVWISTIGAGLLFAVLYCIINYIKVGRFETKEETPPLDTLQLSESGLYQHLEYPARHHHACHYLRRHLLWRVYPHRGRRCYLCLWFGIYCYQTFPAQIQH